MARETKYLDNFCFNLSPEMSQWLDTKVLEAKIDKNPWFKYTKADYVRNLIEREMEQAECQKLTRT